MSRWAGCGGGSSGASAKRPIDLPVGNYVLTVESAPGKWAQLKTSFGATEFVPVAADKDTTVGELTIEEKK